MQYSQQETQKLFDSLPAELKDALMSEETANRIGDICARQEISGANISKLAKMVGDVLMGLLAPNELTEALKDELAIADDKAEKISREVNRFILFPVKREMAEFYKEISFKPGGEISKKTQTEEAKNKSVDDIYREAIETQ